MRFTSAAGALALLGMGACVSTPESFDPMNTGVGFGDYQRYLAERDSLHQTSSTPYSVPPEPARSAQTGAIVPPSEMPPAPNALDAVPVRYAAAAAAPAPAPQVATQPLPSAQTFAQAPAQPPVRTQPVRTQTLAPAATQPLAAPMRREAQPTQQAPVQTASVGTLRPVPASATFGTTPAFDAGPSMRPGISDEQDFNAVSARESIESDRARIQQQREQYQVIEVASVPDSTVSGGPNIVAYALSTSHAPGTTVHRRLNPLRWSRWENACLQFRNQDAAQEAFLAEGGPNRDPGYLDPDGDGYACWWDPTALRQAMASN